MVGDFREAELERLWRSIDRRDETIERLREALGKVAWPKLEIVERVG